HSGHSGHSRVSGRCRARAALPPRARPRPAVSPVACAVPYVRPRRARARGRRLMGAVPLLRQALRGGRLPASMPHTRKRATGRRGSGRALHRSRGGVHSGMTKKHASYVSPRLVTAQEAAALVGVAYATVRSWVRRGHLSPVVVQDGTALYAEREVYECERLRR